MIWDSVPWKRELSRLATRLRRYTKQKWNEETSNFVLERDTFYAAYVIRKMIDAFKISDEVEALRIAAIEYPSDGRTPDVMNWHHFDEMFDFSNGKPCKIKVKDFCNQFIHSFIFTPVLEEGTNTLIGIFVVSDFRKKQCLLYFELGDVIELLRSVSQDNIVNAEYLRDPATNEMKVVKKSSKHIAAQMVAFKNPNSKKS